MDARTVTVGLALLFALTPSVIAAPKASQVPPLVEKLKQDPDPKVRAEAAQELRHVGSVKAAFTRLAVPDLVLALQDPDAGVRREVAITLGEIKADPKLVVAPLTRALKDKDTGVRAAAAESLASFGVAATAALPALAEMQADVNKLSGDDREKNIPLILAVNSAVKTLRRVDLSDKDLSDLWENLASNHEGAAGEAVAGLLLASRQAVPFLRDRLQKLRSEEGEKRIPGLIHLLDDDRFAVREKAALDLADLGAIATPHLEQALKGKISVEARYRAEHLLEKLYVAVDGEGTRLRYWLTDGLPPEQRRAQRAVAALKLMATPEAGNLLDELARGSAGAWLAVEARSPIDRGRPTK